MSELDIHFMRLAIAEAEKARDLDEVPIGAVLLAPAGEILAAASNRTITDSDPTAHAEILALREAARKIGNYRLAGCTLYTTIEPCVMCAGAFVNARISRLVFGALDERFGAVETKFRLCDSDQLNHRMEIVSGVLADECRSLIQAFFRERRAERSPGKDSRLELNQRIRISRSYHWAQDAVGTIAEAPLEVRRLAPGWLSTIHCIQDGKLSYWVRFDMPQADADGDGPYAEAAIDERFIETANHT